MEDMVETVESIKKRIGEVLDRLEEAWKDVEDYDGGIDVDNLLKEGKYLVELIDID